MTELGYNSFLFFCEISVFAFDSQIKSCLFTLFSAFSIDMIFLIYI